MNVIEVRVEDLVPYENNPRKNGNVEQVENSIREFGFLVPLVIDKENIIVCGHSRYLAAKSLGLKTVPAVRADDLTEKQIEAFRLVENKTAELAGWDFEKLDEELADLKDIDMKQFGFNPVAAFEDIDFDSFGGSSGGGGEQHKEYRCPCCGQWFEVKS